MTLFVAIAKTSPEKLRDKIMSVYPSENAEFSPSVWFLYDTVSTAEVAKKLGIADGTSGVHGIVFSAASGWTG
jgi:hypothetical protein